MELYDSPEGYLYNLYASSSAEAKKLWRQSIREKWNHQCAYCGSDKDLTLDHIIPQAKGGKDTTKNLLCCCQKCNNSKGHTDWQLWYREQYFYCKGRECMIHKWMQPDPPINLYEYRPRRTLNN